MKIKHIWVNLSLFDGAAAGEGATGESSGESAPSAAGTESGEGEYTEEESDADSEPSPEEREEAYKTFKKEYKDLYAKDTQELINRRFKETKNLEKQLGEYSQLMNFLSQRYGTSDIQSTIKAMENDNAYWEQAAYDAGMSVEQYKEVSRLKRENAALLQAQQQVQQQQETDRIFAEWKEQEAEIQEIYPDFDAEEEISNNPDFARLLSSGVPMRHAYEVIHLDEIQEATVNFTAKQTAKAVTDNIRAKGNRPVENGAASQNAFTQKVDVSKLTDKEMDDLIRRARSGETVTL